MILLQPKPLSPCKEAPSPRSGSPESLQAGLMTVGKSPAALPAEAVCAGALSCRRALWGPSVAIPICREGPCLARSPGPWETQEASQAAGRTQRLGVLFSGKAPPLLVSVWGSVFPRGAQGSECGVSGLCGGGPGSCRGGTGALRDSAPMWEGQGPRETPPRGGGLLHGPDCLFVFLLFRAAPAAYEGS